MKIHYEKRIKACNAVFDYFFFYFLGEGKLMLTAVSSKRLSKEIKNARLC